MDVLGNKLKYFPLEKIRTTECAVLKMIPIDIAVFEAILLKISIVDNNIMVYISRFSPPLIRRFLPLFYLNWRNKQSIFMSTFNIKITNIAANLQKTFLGIS